MYQTKNLGLNITEIEKDKLQPFSFNIDLGDNFKAIDEKTLSHRNITNCLLEVPQDIKYTLENGALTLDAGSIVYVPYGTEDKTAEFPIGSTFLNDNFKVVGTQYTNGKFFVWAEVQNNISENIAQTDTSIRLLSVELTASKFRASFYNGSGTEDLSETLNYLLYRTDENIIKGYTSGKLDDGVWCLPLLRVQADGTYMYGSVVQVFNGFGYIGSTVFALPGVKGLVPNGKNEDGSLNSIEFTTNKVHLYKIEDSLNANFYIGLNAQGLWRLYHTVHTYNEEKNLIIEKDRNIIWDAALVVTGTANKGLISDFKPKKPFRAVDYSDYSTKIAELESKIQALQAAVEALQG